MKSALVPLALLALLGGATHAVETTQWPPPPEAAARMRELQHVITSRESTAEQRNEARAELGRLMRAPSAQGPLPHTRPRAAIEPAAPVKSAVVPMPMGPPPETAKLEVVSPSRAEPAVPLGPLPAPIGQLGVDPRTGHVIQKTPAGYVDTVTGQPVKR